MPAPAAHFGAIDAWAAFVGIAVVAFLVTWIVTDRLHVRRTPYVGILFGLVLALAAGYVAWSGTSPSELVLDAWGPALLAGAVAGVALVPLVRRAGPTPGPHRRPTAVGFLWEGVVYGAAEGTLLAALPALAVWQALAAGGHTGGTTARVATGALAVLGSLVVVLVHHLGYAEFRRRDARAKLGGALVACGLQAVAFVIVGNVLAPIVAHVVLHAELLVGRVEMPPSRVARPRLAYLAGSERVHERDRSDGGRLARR